MPSKKKPNVFLAGAPKCGTTSMAHWLSTHPQCFVSPKKEPHFFGDFLRKCMTMQEYEKLFLNAPSNCDAIIDASTSYFTMPEAIDAILAYQPDAKFIIMLRNPIDLVYSLHSENLFLGREKEVEFANAWELQDLRREGRYVPVSCQNPKMLLYRDQALLGQALSYLLERVERHQIHWIFFEDLATKPANCYQEVLSFLGLPNDNRQHFNSLNQSKIHRYPELNRILRTLGIWRAKLGLPGIGLRARFNRGVATPKERTPLTPEMRWELYQAFHNDIELLSQLTKRNLSNWMPPNPMQNKSS